MTRDFSPLFIVALKSSSAGFQFLILLLTARWFGVEHRGEIALFTAGVGLLVLLNGFAGSASITYICGRNPRVSVLKAVIGFSYGFCILISSSTLGLVGFLGVHDPTQGAKMVLIGAMNSMVGINAFVLLSSKRVWQASIVETARHAFLIALSLTYSVVARLHTPDEYYTVWCVASAIALVLSLLLVKAHAGTLNTSDENVAMGDILRQLLSHNFVAHASNFVQFLNYRSLFIALEGHTSLRAVGVFSTAVSLMELLWIVANSLGSFMTNRVVQQKDAVTPHVIGFVVRATLALTLALAALITLVPNSVFVAAFGAQFAGVKPVLMQLMPGAILTAPAIILSAANAGQARYLTNLLAALAGLVPTLMGLTILVPQLGLEGAVIAKNVSYVFTGLYLVFAFIRAEGQSLKVFLPRSSDLLWLRKVM